MSHDCDMEALKNIQFYCEDKWWKLQYISVCLIQSYHMIFGDLEYSACGPFL